MVLIFGLAPLPAPRPTRPRPSRAGGYLAYHVGPGGEGEGEGEGEWRGRIPLEHARHAWGPLESNEINETASNRFLIQRTSQISPDSCSYPPRPSPPPPSQFAPVSIRALTNGPEEEIRQRGK